ncbi:hypothetical protein [Methylobacterium oryzisoli]|uniref:hypothetical protein n=1 Tax=Methylobacterium oryzisoli TaxID=3385502 RepID=UPI00389176C3
MKITEKRRRVLAALDAWDWEKNGCMTAFDIGHRCCRGNNFSDWAHAPLREMSAAGMVELVGKARCGSRTWRITDAGRAALQSQGDAA